MGQHHRSRKIAYKDQSGGFACQQNHTKGPGRGRAGDVTPARSPRGRVATWPTVCATGSAVPDPLVPRLPRRRPGATHRGSRLGTVGGWARSKSHPPKRLVRPSSCSAASNAITWWVQLPWRSVTPAELDHVVSAVTATRCAQGALSAGTKYASSAAPYTQHPAEEGVLVHRGAQILDCNLRTAARDQRLLHGVLHLAHRSAVRAALEESRCLGVQAGKDQHFAAIPLLAGSKCCKACGRPVHSGTASHFDFAQHGRGEVVRHARGCSAPLLSLESLLFLR